MTRNTIKIGEILIEQGVLNEQQVFEILQAQKDQRMPFGVLAERMFDVTLHSIESAWVEQYHRFTGTIDLAHEKFDNEALRVLNRRQAWQFELLPNTQFECGNPVCSRDRWHASETCLALDIKTILIRKYTIRHFRPSQLKRLATTAFARDGAGMLRACLGLV